MPASPNAGRYPWVVCFTSLLLVFFGQGAMFVLNVELKPIADSMGWPRELPSLGYTAAFLGAGIGALYFGPLSERFGMGNVALIGALSVGSGTFLAGYVETPGQLMLIFGLLIGLLGNACMFAPLVAHVMRWFDRNRGLALGIATAGQSVGGAVWPFVITWLDGAVGWRDTFHIYGLLCFAIMVPLTLLLRRPAPPIASGSPRHATPDGRAFGLPGGVATAVLCAAIVGCCIPMSIPLVHLKAYGTDLGFAPQAAAAALSLALFASLTSRILGGMLADRIGGLKTLLIGSTVQCAMLAAISQAREMWTLYAVCIVFGIGYGGIIGMYAYLVREYFPPAGATRRIAWIFLFGTIGMAAGGWLGGRLFDATGSYETAFLAGSAINVVQLVIVAVLLVRARPALRLAPA